MLDGLSNFVLLEDCHDGFSILSFGSNPSGASVCGVVFATRFGLVFQLVIL